MTTFSYQTTRRAWLRNIPTYGFVTIDDADVRHLIAAWTRVWLDGGWLLNDFRRNGEPARLDVVVTKNGDRKWSFEMKVDGLLVARFDVSKAEKPKHGRIYVRSANPFYMSEDDHVPAM